jgi:hypothetical protein
MMRLPRASATIKTDPIPSIGYVGDYFTVDSTPIRRPTDRAADHEPAPDNFTYSGVS